MLVDVIDSVILQNAFENCGDTVAFCALIHHGDIVDPDSSVGFAFDVCCEIF